MVLQELLAEAQRLIDTPPVSREAYAAWKLQAEQQIITCLGPDSPALRQLRLQGAMPTSFFGASLAAIGVRLTAERSARLLSMKAVMETALQGSAIAGAAAAQR